MSNGERYDQMMRAKEGAIDVMIGPRSALFTPFPNLGLIVIDEEHESTYKSEQIPRYHARDIASIRSEYRNSIVPYVLSTFSSTSVGRTDESMLSSSFHLIHVQTFVLVNYIEKNRP